MASMLASTKYVCGCGSVICDRPANRNQHNNTLKHRAWESGPRTVIAPLAPVVVGARLHVGEGGAHVWTMAHGWTQAPESPPAAPESPPPGRVLDDQIMEYNVKFTLNQMQRDADALKKNV
jgi:hypothetical protein